MKGNASTAEGAGPGSAPQASNRVQRLTIIAQDPDVTLDGGQILTAEVAVPIDRLEVITVAAPCRGSEPFKVQPA
jgi:hypothetical protein